MGRSAGVREPRVGTRGTAGGDASGPVLLSVNVGVPSEHEWSGGVVRTAIWKSPVDGPVRAGRLNLAGDDQADKMGHGGEHRAVLVYQIESYEHWQRHLGRDDFVHGQFGENFTVSGLADDEVCIGDRYRIGTAVFEVTQPRVTCYRVGIRLGVPTMAALLVQHRRPGFYLRVLEEGEVAAGDGVTRVSRPSTTLTVAAIDSLLYLSGRSTDDLRTAVRIDALSGGWRDDFRRRLDEAVAREDSPPQDGWTGFRPLSVVEVQPETEDIRSITFADPDGHPLPAARPGQYLTLRVSDGSGTAVRNYSLSSAPGTGQYRISVKRETGGRVSPWLHASARAGAEVEVAQPRGDFVLRPGTEPVLLASAGVGVTPVLAMLHALAEESPDRPVRWLHVTRNPHTQPFRDEVAALLRQLTSASAHVFYTVSLPDGPGEDDCVHRHLGRPDAGAVAALGLTADTDAYLCGPPSFMAGMTDLLAGAGLPGGQVHSEAFGAAAVAGAGGPVHPPEGPPGTGPAITFARSGLTVPFPDGVGNLLELAEACDVPVHWSCRTGVCHSCATPLLSGSVRYAPDPLDPPEAGQVLLCCATPTDEVVLDA